MRTEKLKQILSVLAQVPPEKFDMNQWECGTTACAIGWAIRELPPDFGLFLRTNTRFGTISGVENRLGDTDYEAIGEVLDIPSRDAFWLFSPIAYEDRPGVKEVSDRITSYLDGECPPDGPLGETE